MMIVHELDYSKTNTYLIEGDSGNLLFDTGWAGSFPDFCRSVKNTGIAARDIDFILISHFHPDHMGIAGEIASLGPVILLPEVQSGFIHSSDAIFEREKGIRFYPVEDDKVRSFKISDSRALLKEIGIDGEIIHTPGHSDDSISLALDDGSLFVGDLNPLYELELHKGTQIEESWNKLLSFHPKIIYYGHAKKAIPDGALPDRTVHDGTVPDRAVLNGALPDRTIPDRALPDGSMPGGTAKETAGSGEYALVSRIMNLIDKGCDVKKIQKKTGADISFIRDVMRMYLTHQNVGVQGILDRIEIKGR